MSDRKLVLLPFLVLVLYLASPMPNPRPWPAEIVSCFGCSEPVWLSEPVHMVVSLPMVALFFITILKAALVLYTGKLMDHWLFRAVAPILWLVFFSGAGYYLWLGASHLIAYDVTSLIPFFGFAVVDFVFVARLAKNDKLLVA